MNQFKDFGIKPLDKSFTGDKIQIKRVLNTPIVVMDYKIGESKQKENTRFMTLQIEFKEEKRVIFTGSSGLMEQIKNIPKDKFPFVTTISDMNEYFEFT